VISSEQIDRFEAIRLLQQSLERNPSALADWVILGELAHEVAVEAPPDQAQKYYKMSRDAYLKALALAPKNAGLKAAVLFAKEQEEGFNRFEGSRRAAAKTYIEARRRDVAATNYMPMVRTFMAPPVSMRRTTGEPAPAVTSTATGTDVVVSSATAAAATPPAGVIVANPNPAVTPIYANPIYLPYNVTGGVPYTYQQYSSAYYPSGYYANQTVPPVTLQRYTQVMSQGIRKPLRPVPAISPGPVPPTDGR
jgi:hypothetical protein